MALACEVGRSVTPWGGGTAASVGMPTAGAGLILGLRRMAQLLDHEPGDLTATVEAGMTVEAFQAALGRRGQWLSLDPPDADRATVGGVLATNACGPRRHLYGTARDLLIGVTVVTADGSVVKGGGKVVKNVAGYDLPKLFIGSYGTLRAIVEATVKLRPLAEHEDLVCVRFDRLKDARAAGKAVASSDLIPNAVELLDATAAMAAVVTEWREIAHAGAGPAKPGPGRDAAQCRVPVWCDRGAAGRPTEGVMPPRAAGTIPHPRRCVDGLRPPVPGPHRSRSSSA